MQNKIFYRVCADAITLLHFLWTFLLIGGAIAVIFRPSYAVFQIAVMTITIVMAFPFGNNCLFTMLEEKLRKKLDPGYTNNRSFMATYLNKIFKTRVSTEKVNRITWILYGISYAISIFALLR